MIEKQKKKLSFTFTYIKANSSLKILKSGYVFVGMLKYYLDHYKYNMYNPKLNYVYKNFMILLLSFIEKKM